MRTASRLLGRFGQALGFGLKSLTRPTSAGVGVGGSVAGEGGSNRIVITHLTRMQPGHVCVAGIDLDTGAHIRPVLASGQLTRNVLASEGGLFAIGAVVHLGPLRNVGRRPAVEDRQFETGRAGLIGYGSAHNFWRVLTNCARPRLTAIFGHDLLRLGGTCGVPLDAGQASLGGLVPAVPPRLYADHAGKLRMEIDDGLVQARVRVADLRLYEADQLTIRADAVANLAQRLRGGAPVILSVGLTRAWPKEKDSLERHWLQVNNIHLCDNVLWQGDEDA